MSTRDRAGESILAAKDLTAGYNGTPVVRGIELEVASGEVVALVGLNGAGKTTILRALVGELKPMSGTVEWLGRPTREPIHRRFREGLSYVSEERSVLMTLTVGENIRLGGADPDVVYDLFPELARMKSRRAGLLSGGEQQMLAIGRALAVDPRLVVIDELSLGLAPTVVARLLETITRAARDGVAVLLVEQQIRTALSVADHGYIVHRGEIHAAGTGDELTHLFDENQTPLFAASDV